MFMSQFSLADARVFYDDVKGRVEKYGRNPDDVKLMPGAYICVGRTEEEASEKLAELESLIPLNVALLRLSSKLGGIDLSSYPLDGPMPKIAGNTARVSAPESYGKIARAEKLTLRQTAMRAAASNHHWVVKGSAKHVADQLEHWFVNEGADGFNLLPPIVPGGIDDFVDLVVPELQRRGLFRTEYEGKTLRENLGVPRPVHPARRTAVPQRAAE
jgi:alkanesulfonate monooxygenase